MKVFINERIYFSGSLWIPSGEQECRDNILELIKILNCFNFLKECEVYYSGSGMTSLFENLEFLSDGYLLHNEVVQLRTLVGKIDAVDWDDKRNQKTYENNYYLQRAGGEVVHIVNNSTLGEAAEYRFQGLSVAILNMISSEFNESSVLYINRSQILPPRIMNLLDVSILKSTDETINYFLKNRQKIEFRLNPKHGENHKLVKTVNGNVISPLECKKSHADKILQISVGGSSKQKELYSYDENSEKFIVFKYDNTNNPRTYHGYHPHNQEEVPIAVREFILANLVLHRL